MYCTQRTANGGPSHKNTFRVSTPNINVSNPGRRNQVETGLINKSFF